MTLAVLVSVAPLLALLCALLLRRYPGEQAITLLRSRRAPVAAQRPRGPARLVRHRSQALLPRGGRLVAAAVAARPPPRWMTRPTPSSI